MPRLSAPIAATVTLGDAIAAWHSALSASDRSAGTVHSYGYATGKLAAHVPPATPLPSVTTWRRCSPR